LEKNTSKTVVIPTEKGERGLVFQIRSENACITIKRDGDPKPWQVQLMGIDALSSVEGGEVKSETNGIKIVLEPGVAALKIKL
jgi:hypothetical protein